MTVHILVPMDSSPLAARALEHALTMYPEDRITVLYVVDYIEESYSARALLGTEELRDRGEERAAEVFETATEIADGYDATVETRTVFGEASREIVSYAEEHDVEQIVIGSHGRSPVSRLILGDVAKDVVRRAPVPVTIVR